MSNHTPVPWKIGAYCSRPNADGMKGHRIISDGDDGFEFHIAAVGTHPGINSEAARANAVLIIEAVNNYAAMRTGIESLRLQLVKVREALEFYADGERYNGPNQRLVGDDKYTRADAAYLKDVTRDGGDLARRALALSE